MAVVVSTPRAATILFDKIEEFLTFLLKQMGLVSMFNGLDILQARFYIKLSCTTYIERISEQHLTE